MRSASSPAPTRMNSRTPPACRIVLRRKDEIARRAGMMNGGPEIPRGEPVCGEPMKAARFVGRHAGSERLAQQRMHSQPAPLQRGDQRRKRRPFAPCGGVEGLSPQGFQKIVVENGRERGANQRLARRGRQRLQHLVLDVVAQRREKPWQRRLAARTHLLQQQLQRRWPTFATFDENEARSEPCARAPSRSIGLRPGKPQIGGAHLRQQTARAQGRQRDARAQAAREQAAHMRRQRE